jgi:4-amino-4-deoxy-L-arabinose transferase-like glycosyltransferase
MTGPEASHAPAAAVSPRGTARLWHVWLPPLLLIAPVAAMIIAGRFDGLYGQDPYAYYDYAVGPVRESVLALRPLPPFFWPPGYPLLVALASLIVGVTPAAGQLVSLVMGAVTVLFTALLVDEVWVRRGLAQSAPAWRAPLAAALLVACQPQLWQSSAVVMADTTGLAAATLGAWALARYGRTRGGRWLVLASGGFAFALLSRWIYGLAAVPVAIYALSLLRRPQAGGYQRRGPILHAVAALAVALFVLSPLLMPDPAGTPSPGVEARSFAGNFDVYTWHPLNALRREFVTTDGLLRYSLPNGLYYALAPAHRYYFTPLLALLLLPGLWTAFGRGRRALWWLVAWAALVYAFHAGAPWQNFRFTLGYLTPLAVLAAVGLETLLAWVGPRWQRLVVAGFVLGLLAMLFNAAQLVQGFVARKQADLRTVAAVEALLPPDARLLTFNMTFTFQHYSQIETHELYYLNEAEVTSLLGDAQPTYVLLAEANVLEQWGNEPLGATFRWLRDTRGLEPAGEFGALTLWKVKSVGR